MFRKSFLSIATIVCIARAEQAELLAKNVQKQGSVIFATDQVLLFSPTYLARANKAVYDQESGIVELFGNVNMIRGSSDSSRAEYAKINLNTHEVVFKELFGISKDTEVWVRSNNLSSNNKGYYSDTLLVSSCNVSNPDWSISASSARLDNESKFLHLYNPIFYIGNVPFFWLPYFAFSTDTTRRTGLLFPEFGYSKNDGIYYRQPIYFAPANYYDIELDPQIYTRRGFGGYTTLRFVDSDNSKGLISLGGFKDRNDYRDRENNKIKNKIHKGIEIKYQRDRLISYLLDSSLQEGIWLDATLLNDIEYLNLKNRDSEHGSLVGSRLNYFLANDSQYIGAYLKYHIDTEKIGRGVENQDTLQELPSVQYHKFTDSILLPNLLYSIDFDAQRYSRQIGPEAIKYGFNVPISFHLPVFDNFATFSLSENIYASHIDFSRKITSKNNNSYDNSSNIFENYTKLSLHTDLIKPYSEFYHTINFGIDYIIPGFYNGDNNDDFIYDTNLREYENFLAYERKKEEISAFITEYFYGSSGRKIIKHSISQGYYKKDKEYSNLRNSIYLYPFDNLSIYNKFEYFHKTKRFSLLQSGFYNSNDYFDIDISHTLRQLGTNSKLSLSSVTTRDSFLSANTSVKLPQNYIFDAGIQYDLHRDFTKTWRVGISKSRKCWSYSLKYQTDIEPVTTNNGVEAKKNRGVYFSISFYPMGGVNYTYSLKNNKDNVQ